MCIVDAKRPNANEFCSVSALDLLAAAGCYLNPIFFFFLSNIINFH